MLLRLIGLSQRDAAELTVVDANLRQSRKSGDDALELHVFAAAGARATGLLVHAAIMTAGEPVTLTLINRENADGAKKLRPWRSQPLPQALRLDRKG